MSIHVESWVWKQKVGSPLRKLILVKLAQNADDEGWSWWRQTKIAAECETSRQTVNLHINALRGLGLIQVYSRHRDDGGQRSSAYRVMGPWAVEGDEPPVGFLDTPPDSPTPPVKETDTPLSLSPTPRTVREEPSEEEPPQPPLGRDRPPERLGEKLWRVYSEEGRGPFAADLNNGTCTCENRSKTACRHLRVAEKAEADHGSSRSKAVRDALWDAIVEDFGQPAERAKADRGQVVTDLAELLSAEKVPQVAWASTFHQRYRALVKEWGLGRVTLRSLLGNWHLAGKLVSGATPEPRQRRYTSD